MGNFAITSRIGGGSPALGAAMQRNGSTRGRQNSTQNTSAPRAAPVVAKEINGVHPAPVDGSAAAKNGETHKAVKTEEGVVPDGASARASGRTTDRSASSKREDPVGNPTRPRPPSISTGTRNNGRASKTGTPVAASFPGDTGRPRSGRNTGTTSAPLSGDGLGGLRSAPKRSHKKGAGLAAQQQKAALEAAVAKGTVGTDEGGSVVEGEDEEDGENEPRYCYCGGVSYGEMVACDWKSCPREWFHLECAGLSKAPGKGMLHAA